MLPQIACLIASALVSGSSDAYSRDYANDSGEYELGPYYATFVLSAFQGHGDRPISHALMMEGMEFLIRVNMHWMRLAPNEFPDLDASGISYEHTEGRTDTPWKDAVDMLDTMLGNCKCLVAYEIAKLRLRGIYAKPKLTQIINDDLTQDWHAQTQLPNGRISDPSLRLGM